MLGLKTEQVSDKLSKNSFCTSSSSNPTLQKLIHTCRIIDSKNFLPENSAYYQFEVQKYIDINVMPMHIWIITCTPDLHSSFFKMIHDKFSHQFVVESGSMK